MKRFLTASLTLLGAFAASAFADDAAAPVGPSQGSGQAQSHNDLPVIATVAARKKPAPVKAAQHLRAGTVLHASDLIVDGDDPRSLEAFVGMEIKRAVYAGKVISENDIGLPTIVERNAIVSLEFVRGPLIITTEGRALDAGAAGESVRIMNLSSKIILTAEIVGPNKARTR